MSTVRLQSNGRGMSPQTPDLELAHALLVLVVLVHSSSSSPSSLSPCIVPAPLLLPDLYATRCKQSRSTSTFHTPRPVSLEHVHASAQRGGRYQTVCISSSPLKEIPQEYAFMQYSSKDICCSSPPSRCTLIPGSITHGLTLVHYGMALLPSVCSPTWRAYSVKQIVTLNA